MANILTIYITEDIIKICEIKKKGANILVRRAFHFSTPPDTVEDGLIKDVDAVAGAIQRELRDNGIKKGKLAFTISSRKIANKEITLPYIKNPVKLAEMIESNKDDYFPMGNLEDYVCRHTILDQVESEGNKNYIVSIVAVQKEMINSYFELGKALKLPIETVDYFGNSLYNLLSKQMKSGGGVSLALQIDDDVTYVNIMRGQSQLFRRSVPFGKDSLIQGLASYKGIDAEEAEEILKDPMKLDHAISVEEYGEIIRDLISSITRVVEFYTSKNSEVIVEHAKLFGVGTDVIGLGLIIGRELGLEVTAVKQLNGVQIKKHNKYGLTYSELPGYLPNLGAVIKSLNLKVDDESKRRKSGNYTIFYFLIIMATLIIAGFSGFIIYQYEQLKIQKEQLQADIEKIAEAETIYDTYMTAKGGFDTIQEYYKSTVSDNEAIYRLILELERVMPEGLGISDFSAQNGDVTISGISAGKEPIALFIIKLKEMPFVSNVKLQSISDTYDEFKKPTSIFNMTFHIHEIEELEDEIGESIDSIEAMTGVIAGITEDITEESTEGGGLE